MSNQPGRTAPSTTRLGIVAALVVAVSFVLVTLASGPVVSAVQRAVGADPTVTTARAWFASPRLVDRGLRTGQTVTVVVVPATGGEPRVAARCGGRPIGVRSEPSEGRAREVRLRVRVPAMCANGWLTLQIQGTALPLQAWVR